MKARFFKVNRDQHSYLTFITESYEGLCTVSTVDNARGIIRIIPSQGQGQEQELDGLLMALQGEIGMEELENPAKNPADSVLPAALF